MQLELVQRFRPRLSSKAVELLTVGSFLGGLVNSTAVVAELAQRVKESGGELLAVAYRGVILATAAMMLRNSLLLTIFT